VYFVIESIGMEETAIDDKNTAVAGKTNKTLDAMMEAGVHFGHRASKTHPKMKPYITGVRNSVHIINLEKTQEKLEETLGILGEMAAEGKIVLLVGTKVQARNIIKGMAEKTGMPYVAGRWIGGLLTNFEEISKRLAHLKDVEGKLANEEEASKYTKWERHEMQEEINKLEMKFGGVRNLEKLPDAMFVFDLEENDLAVKEARQKGVKIFAVADTNCNPSAADYTIPANNDAVSSVQYIAKKVQEALSKKA
jgi:small subunit ribosomal protein S2